MHINDISKDKIATEKTELRPRTLTTKKKFIQHFMYVAMNSDNSKYWQQMIIFACLQMCQTVSILNDIPCSFNIIFIVFYFTLPNIKLI